MTEELRTVDAALLSHLQTWQGRTETLRDTITSAPVSGLSATLDREDPAPVPGTALPPLCLYLKLSFQVHGLTMKIQIGHGKFKINFIHYSLNFLKLI